MENILAYTNYMPHNINTQEWIDASDMIVLYPLEIYGNPRLPKCSLPYNSN